MDQFDQGGAGNLARGLLRSGVAGGSTRRQFLRRAGGVLLIGGTGGTLLAACGGDEEGEQAQPTTGAQDTPGTVEAGADLRAGIMGFPVSWDSAFATNTATYLLKNVLDPLVHLAEDLSPLPALAESWESPDGGTTWDFKLVENAAWHDGKPFTSADVETHFRRILDPDTGSAGQQVYEGVRSIDAPDPFTVRFTLKSVDAEFPLLLGLYQGNIQAAHLDPTTLGKDSMVGTGPFKWGEVVPGQSLRLVRNDQYFAAGQPLLDSLTFVSFDDERARLNALLSGGIDVALDIPSNIVTEIEGRDDLSLSESIPGSHALIYLRADKEPGNDPRVMRALKMSVDRDGLVQAALRGQGTAAGDNPIPPGSPSYVEVPVPARDVEGARALLADAGYPDGVHLEMIVPGGRTSDQELALGVQSMAGEAGFNIKLRTIPADVFYADYWLKQDFGVDTWGPRPTLDAQFRIAYACDGIWNESHWCDPEFDRLLNAARTEPDENERAALQKQVQEYFAENGNVMIPYHFAITAAHTPAVQNLKEHPIILYTDFRQVDKAS